MKRDRNITRNYVEMSASAMKLTMTRFKRAISCQKLIYALQCPDYLPGPLHEVVTVLVLAWEARLSAEEQPALLLSLPSEIWAPAASLSLLAPPIGCCLSRSPWRLLSCCDAG